MDTITASPLSIELARLLGEGWRLGEVPESMKTGRLSSLSSAATTTLGSTVRYGRDRLNLLAKGGNVHLGAEDLILFLDNPEMLPAEMKGQYVCFDGTVVVNAEGEEFVLYLKPGVGGNGLDWDWRCLDLSFPTNCVSAISK